MTAPSDMLPLSRAGIDTYRQSVVYMDENCQICRAEGFAALTRIQIDLGDRSIVATLNVVSGADWLGVDTAALSEAAWIALDATNGALARFSHSDPPASTSSIRAKAYGQVLNRAAFDDIIADTLDNRLSDLDLAAFVTACAGDKLNYAETTALTQAMQAAGDTLEWGDRQVLDKHCVGGLPGNRTTPIVVAIVAAAGHLIPKTSSRAITSPAGTADTMEVMAPVDLNRKALRKVVEAEGGCIVWGGKLNLSPADDLLIRIERPLDFDSLGQLVASVLSKKAAVGATDVLIDMPVGPTAKVRSSEAAKVLQTRLARVADTIGLKLAIHKSDGTRPVGRGIGPALEAWDILAVLRGDPTAPVDLRNRALDLAGLLLDMATGGVSGTGRDRAAVLLDSGAAASKFMSICEAQGGFRQPGRASHREPVLAAQSGAVTSIDNRQIARIAKLAGAPRQQRAGVLLHAAIGKRVNKGDPLFEIHAETPGELAYARGYALSQPQAFTLVEAS